jgi:hypothetical protein
MSSSAVSSAKLWEIPSIDGMNIMAAGITELGTQRMGRGTCGVQEDGT